MIAALVAVAMLAGGAGAEDASGPTDQDFLVAKELVIVASTPRYADARRAAEDAAKKLDTRLDLRGFSLTPDGELSLSRKDCDDNGFDYPCYVARGRWDDGTYASIEESKAYDELKPGLFIVVVASGVPGSETITKTLRDAKKAYPDAYSRKVEVCMGCIH